MATPPLPKRYAPFLQQAQTQSALRYGSQEDQLGSLLASLSHDYGQQAQAQRTASMSILGALQGADANLQKTYADSGLTPSLLAQIGNSPTGQRLAGELASGRAGIQSQVLGQQQGDQYIQQHNADMYQQDRGKVADQYMSLEKEKGLYGSSLLEQLITGDHKERHDANVALAAQNHADTQAALSAQNSQDNALIGQGLFPGKDGTLTPLPGGKADPTTNKPKRTTGAGTASPAAQLTAGTAFTTAFGNAKSGLKGKPRDSTTIQHAVDALVAGRPGQPTVKGGVIYDSVPVYDKYDDKKVIGHKQVPRLDPKTGQRVTGPSTPGVPAVPPVPRPIAQAAAEQAAYGYVTTATVRALQKLGYSALQVPGLVTENQARTERRHTQAGAPSQAPGGRGHI